MTDYTTYVRAAAASRELAIVARELASLSDRLTDAATAARALSATTDWRAKAATAFHEKSEAWAGEVSSLGCLAETARLDAENAHHRAAMIASDLAASLASAGAYR